jgi:hypothetical protein
MQTMTPKQTCPSYTILQTLLPWHISALLTYLLYWHICSIDISVLTLAVSLINASIQHTILGHCILTSFIELNLMMFILLHIWSYSLLMLSIVLTYLILLLTNVLNYTSIYLLSNTSISSYLLELCHCDVWKKCTSASDSSKSRCSMWRICACRATTFVLAS